MEKHIKLQKAKRKRKHGFLKKMSSHGGKKVLKRRRNTKRALLTI